MTSWQFASLPIWLLGFVFMYVAIAIGLGTKKSDGETKSDLMAQCAIGMAMGIPFLILAAWMYHVPAC